MCRHRGNIHIPFQEAGLLRALQISYKISRYVYHESFKSLQFLSVICFHVILGRPGSCFPSTCMSKALLTAPLEHSTCPYQQSHFSSRMRYRSSMQTCTSNSLDLVVTMSCGLTLHICLIIALSFAADIGGLALSMAKSYRHGALRSTHNTCTHSHVSWKRAGGKSQPVATPWTSSRWFSHVLCCKVHSHRLLRACLPGSKRKIPPPACQVRLGTSLCGLLSKGHAVPWHCVHL